MNRSSLSPALLLSIVLSASLLVACSSGSSSSSTPGAEAGAPSSDSCSKKGTHLQSCAKDSECYSGNCDKGSCYVGDQSTCKTAADCQGLAPNDSYTAACFADSTKHGCAIYCSQ